jgi:nitrogen-specific signal transduction histidine kinase
VERSPSFEIASEEALLLFNRATVLMHTVRAVAHELNNVFQTISGAAELLGFNPAFPAALEPKLQTFAKQITRGRELVDAVSLLARSDLPRGSVTNVARAVTRVAQLRTHEQTRAGIEMTTSLTADSSRDVVADPLDVQMLLLNMTILAEQAVAGAATRTITVSGMSDIETCRVIMADSGVGGAAEDQHIQQLVQSIAIAAITALAARHRGSFEQRRTKTGGEMILTLPRAH